MPPPKAAAAAEEDDGVRIERPARHASHARHGRKYQRSRAPIAMTDAEGMLGAQVAAAEVLARVVDGAAAALYERYLAAREGAFVRGFPRV